MCVEVSGSSEGETSVLDFGSEEVVAKEELPAPSKEMDDSLELSLEKALKMVLENGGAKKEVFSLFKTLFGKTLVERVIQLKIYKKWPKQLSREQCLIALGAVGHSVTLEDLEQCFAELKMGDFSRAILKQAQIPYLRMWSSSVKGLPSFWRNHLLNLFRNPMQMLDPLYSTHFGQELLDAKLHKTRCLSYTYYHFEIHQLAEQGDRSRPEFFMASKELLAKLIAYADPETTQNGMVVSLFDEQTGKLNDYQLTGQVHHKGLNAYFLTPLDLGKGLRAQLLFRGTACPLSAQRDLDPSGVGKSSYDECADQIQSLINEYAEKVKEPRIDFIGHSLGGTDAKRAVIKALDPENNLLSEMRLFAFCSPKLDASTIEQWDRHLEALKSRSDRPDIKFNFAYHKNDVVTWSGHANLSGTDGYFIPSNYLVVDSESGMTGTHLHHTAPFFRSGNFNFEIDHRTFEFYQSFSEEELFQSLKKLEELQNTRSWLVTLKSYLFNGETLEDCQRRIEDLQRRKEKLKELDKESWLVWSALQAVHYTIQPVMYYAIGWYSWCIGEDRHPIQAKKREKK